jgi:hypothetical protein
MPNKDVERLIEKHIATIMAFVCSRKRLSAIVTSDHVSDWSYLQGAFFEAAERQAERALLELGLYVRIADDSGDRFLSKYQRSEGIEFGKLIKRDGSCHPLYFREVPNKIIHASDYRWESLVENGQPTVTCLAGNQQDARYDWAEASIDLVSLFRCCGLLWLI